MRTLVMLMVLLTAFAWAQDEPENLAFEKPVTMNGGAGQGGPELLTDGETATDPYLGGPTEVQIDLEDVYKVNMVKIWHYWGDGRTYHDNKVALSLDPDFNGEEAVIFDSTVDGEYPETAEGKTITFDPIEAQHLHAWLGGNTVNQWSHWVEIQVFFDPGLLPVKPAGKLATTWAKMKRE